MRRFILGIVCLLLLSSFAFAQSAVAPTPQQLTEIAERGRLIGEYDQAAWHATDAVQALKPADGEFVCYVGMKQADGLWTVVFGHFNERQTKFLITYEARQGASLQDFTVIHHNPAMEDSDFYLHGAKAILTAMDEFNRSRPTRRYNLTLLPAAAGWFVYALPAQTDLTVLPYGGDLRYRVSADGLKIDETRQMHQTVLEEPVGTPPPFMGFHTHFLSNVPEDSDVFYALARRATEGELLVTPRFTYRITPSGTFIVVGTTETFAKAMEETNCELIPTEKTFCEKSTQELRDHLTGVIRRLLE